MRTEQDLIDGNIKLHNYFTGKTWSKPEVYFHEGKKGKEFLTLKVKHSKEEYAWLIYHSKTGFHSLWQVLQKIRKELYSWILDSRINRLKYWNTLELKVKYYEDPIDIFWAAVELIKEYNKYLNSSKS